MNESNSSIVTKIGKVTSRKNVFKCTSFSGKDTNRSTHSIFSETRVERHEQTREVFPRPMQVEVSGSESLSDDSQYMSDDLEGTGFSTRRWKLRRRTRVSH